MVQVPVCAVVCFAVGVPYLLLGWNHFKSFGLNAAAQGVLLFLCINAVICLWELCLCYRYNLIRSTHLKRVKDGQTRSIAVIVFRWMELKDVFSPDFWANVWIDYSRYDHAYSNNLALGYNIDVGNGHSTFLPTLFLMASMVNPPLGPKTTGMVGLVTYYQMLYGTFLYFFSYFNSGSYKCCVSATEVVVAVVMPSMPWIIFSFIGIVASIRLIMDEDFSVWQG